MPLRRALAALLLCAPLGRAFGACDPAPLPPQNPVRDQLRVRRVIDAVSKLQTPFQAVPLPKAIPTDPDQHDAVVADWNRELQAFKAKNFYKQTDDMAPHKTMGSLPCFHQVVCDENVVVVSPSGPRVTLTAGEFHYLVLHQQVSQENLAALESLLKPVLEPQSSLKPAKVRRFQWWFRKNVDGLNSSGR